MDKIKLFEISLIVLLTITSIFLGVVVRPFLERDSSIVLHRAYLDVNKSDDGWFTEGTYFPKEQTIHLSLSSSNPLRLLYHEYSHKIYHELSDQELEWWDKEVCDLEHNLTPRYDNLTCNEQFARVMAEFILAQSELEKHSHNQTNYDYYKKNSLFVYQTIGNEWTNLTNIYQQHILR